MSDLFGPVEVTRREKIQCLQRELKYRVRVYSRRVAEGKMTQKLADRELRVMKAILADYEKAPG